VLGDILLDSMTIKATGHIPSEAISETRTLEVYSSKGAWITPRLSGSSQACLHAILSDKGAVDVPICLKCVLQVLSTRPHGTHRSPLI